MSFRGICGNLMRKSRVFILRCSVRQIEQLKTLLSVFIATSAFYIFRCSNWNQKMKFDWIIGVQDIASTLYGLDRSVKNKYSVCLFPDQYFNYKFDVVLRGKYPVRLHRLCVGAYLLGRLAANSRGFIFNGNAGFLSINDERETEFRFLKKRGKVIVVFFCGSEIRSPKKVIELCNRIGKDHLARYQLLQSPQMGTSDYEGDLINRCKATEKYADQIYNFDADQASYFTRATSPSPNLIRDEVFNFGLEKFNDLSCIRILHAPSNPFIKGTQVVRAAIKDLANQGYEFEYKELQNVSNEEVLMELKKSHIVLNQFYAFVPGVFGMEALANCCVVLQSASREVERGLPDDANRAWVVTEAHEITRNLRAVLDNPLMMKGIAEFGYAWAYENCSISRRGQRLNSELENLLNSRKLQT